MVVPKKESTILPNTQYTINGSYKDSYLPPITTVQDNNSAPVITSNASFSMPGGLTNVTTVNTTDANSNLLVNNSVIKITGGADMAKFSTISATGTNSSASGALNFITAPTWTSNLDANSDHIYNVQITATDSLGTTAVKDIAITILQPIITTTGTLSSFNYTYGTGPSGPQSFTVSGSNLYSNLTVTAPTDFEISTSSGGTYTSSIPLTYASSAVSTTPIYVRLKAGKSVGSYSGNISIIGTDATTKTVSASGSVSASIITGTENLTAQDINIFTDEYNNIKIIKNIDKKIKVSIYTIDGRLLKMGMFTQPIISIKNDFKAGVYIVSVNTQEYTVNKKVIIN